MRGITFQHADVHDAYARKAPDARIVQIEQVVTEVNRLKVQGSQANIYDSLIDELVEQSMSLTHDIEYTREPMSWSPAMRIVWRSSHMSYESRQDVIDRPVLSDSAIAYAYVNAGRWLVTCPFPGCHGAQYACWEDRRFWCVDCDNRAIRGQWVRVEWPDNSIEIEEALLRRPAEARHWLPGETVDDLLAQDIEHEREH